MKLTQQEIKDKLIVYDCMNLQFLAGYDSTIRMKYENSTSTSYNDAIELLTPFYKSNGGIPDYMIQLLKNVYNIITPSIY